jgi:hypothetical protein
MNADSRFCTTDCQSENRSATVNPERIRDNQLNPHHLWFIKSLDPVPVP